MQHADPALPNRQLAIGNRQSPRVILHVPQRRHVLDALADELDVPDEHRRAGVQTLLVRYAHHAEPVVAGALAQAYLAPHARGEDLAAAAGDRVEARGVEAADDVTYVH